MFAFRIATRHGIGHLMRMKWLALELQERGHQCMFILDAHSQDVSSFISEMAIPSYRLKSPIDEDQDAEQSLELIGRFPQIETVILDSHQLGTRWEQRVRNNGLKLVVFDDIAREHDCDVLLDQKWAGEATRSRYQGKLPPDCQTFLGPDYCILAPDYREFECQESPNKSVSQILVSLGGGGDLALVAAFINELYAQLEHRHIQTSIVIGPQALNVADVEKLAAENSDIQLLYQPKTLVEHFRQADLFVGALGTSLYELVSTCTPAITFSISDNQQNRFEDLACLGHYLHLPELEQAEAESFASLMIIAIDQLDRLQKMSANPPITIDGRGVKRIADILLQTEQMTVRPVMTKPNPLCEQKYLHRFRDNLTIRVLEDSDIHHYRLSRNQRNNADRMIGKHEIAPLEHYNWWFNNARESFVLCQNSVPKMYIWHQVSVKNSKQYLYGGWFTAGEEVSFSLPMLALQWQLDYTKTQYPDGHWLAVIHKDNKFVNLLNQYMGFSAVQDQHTREVTQSILPHASADYFNFVELDFGLSKPS